MYFKYIYIMDSKHTYYNASIICKKTNVNDKNSKLPKANFSLLNRAGKRQHMPYKMIKGLSKKIAVGAGFVYTTGKVNLQKNIPIQDASGQDALAGCSI